MLSSYGQGIDHGTISRTNKTIGVCLENGTFMLLNIAYDKYQHIAPSGEDKNSPTYEWKKPGDRIQHAQKEGQTENLQSLFFNCKDK